jgi:hypothetical protein
MDFAEVHVAWQAPSSQLAACEYQNNIGEDDPARLFFRALCAHICRQVLNRSFRSLGLGIRIKLWP